MVNTNQEKYKQICEQAGEEIPLFAQHWWWEAATRAENKTWDVLFCHNAENEIVGAMPYLLVRKWGMRFILLPQLTQYTHIWTAPQLSPTQQTEVYRNLAAQIKKINPTYCCLHFTPGTNTYKVFSEAGFTTKERHTYRINDLDSPIEVIQNRCSKSKRRRFNKSEHLIVNFNLSEKEYYAFHKKCLSLRDKTISYSPKLFFSLFEKAKSQQQGQIIAIRSNTDNRLLAADFVVWDKNFLYYLDTSFDIHHNDTGAMIRLTLETIRFAQTKSKHFDFEGSMIPGVAIYNQEFGGTKTIYYGVERFGNPIVKYLWKLR